MNFCGAGSEQVLDGDSSSAGKMPEPGVVGSRNFRCGGCTATIDSNETMFPTANLLSGIEDEDSSDEEEDEEEPNNMKQTLELAATIRRTHQQPLKAALDSIQQTLDDPQNDSNSLSKIAIGAGGSPPKTKMKRDGTTISTAFNASPSPNLLNPLGPDWKEPLETNNELNSQLLCPILDTSASISSSLGSVVQRLENGFWVRLIRGPAPCLAGNHRVRLYLHEDRTRFWIESADRTNSLSVDKKKNEVDLGIDLPVNIILRLEVGSNPKAFSIVVEKKRGELLYYDFEAATVIDREIMATSIMLLLDQTHNSCGEDEVGDEDWTGGTEEQPIPCSPSLEKDRSNEFHQLSPTRRTRIFNSVNNRETETSLVIHLEDMSVSASDVSTRAGDEWSCRSVPTLSSQRKNGRTDEQSLDCKPSASSTHLGLNAVSSANLAATAWCPADSCALALNDIADTCTGIFALKQVESSCVGNEHQVVVEEFIASALGAPTAVYTYLTERDIWNTEGSSSTHEASRDARNAVFRNRASLLNAQAARLRGLRNEMTFAAALKQSKEKMQFVQTVQSFDDVYARSAGTKKLKAATRAANRFHSSALLQTVVGNMKMHDTNGNSVEEEGGVAFYDSDPEDSRHRNSKKGPRQLAASRIQITNDATPAACHHHHALSNVGFDEIGSGKKVSKRLDEETIVDIVHVSTSSVFVRSRPVPPLTQISISPAVHEQRKTHAHVASYTNER